MNLVGSGVRLYPARSVVIGSFFASGAAEGTRLPDVDHSQSKFDTGIVFVVECGQTPSPQLLEQASGTSEPRNFILTFAPTGIR